MSKKVLGRCPVCGEKLDVIRLHCAACDTTIEGTFENCKFCQLPTEQVEFIEVFLKCRGNIKEVERELGISYPTVRSRLEGVIQALGFKAEPVVDDTKDQQREVLNALSRGEITAEEAIKLLKQL